MPRPIILSNNTMLVGINRYGLVHDFYYPYVGLEDHDTARELRHRIGVWIDGRFSWLDDDTWETSLEYEPNTLISRIITSNKKLEVRLEFHDCINPAANILTRRVTVTNLAGNDREIRLMMHQVFRISNSLNGDTAQYLPMEKAILHYKGLRYFVVKACTPDGQSFDQHSIGLEGIESHEGTFKDAEDGELGGNPVEHGSVDSVVRCRLEIPAGNNQTVDYWVSCGRSIDEALNASRRITADNYEHRLQEARDTWRRWLATGAKSLEGLSEERQDRFNKSLLLIKAHTDRMGSVIASSDSQMLNYDLDFYTYCWPRDSYYALWPLARIGHTLELKAFFDFCLRAMRDDGYMMHKYQADAALGSSWHPYIQDGRPELPIQEDETAVVILLARNYYRATGDGRYIKRIFSSLIKPMADFMARYIDRDTKLPHGSYDLWEEVFMTTTYTTAVTYAALAAAAEIAELCGAEEDAITWQAVADDMRTAAHKQLFNSQEGYFYKGLRRTNEGVEPVATIDSSSLYGAWMYGLYDIDDPHIKTAVATLQDRLEIQQPGGRFGGVSRYNGDRYFNDDPKRNAGNPWFVTSLWLAQYYIACGDIAQAERIITWTEQHMTPSGVLSEQIDRLSGEPKSVAPLVWSQAEYCLTVLDLQAAAHRTAHPRRKPGLPRDKYWRAKRNYAYI